MIFGRLRPDTLSAGLSAGPPISPSLNSMLNILTPFLSVGLHAPTDHTPDYFLHPQKVGKKRHLPSLTCPAGLLNGHIAPAHCPAFPHTTSHLTSPSRRQNLQRKKENVMPKPICCSHPNEFLLLQQSHVALKRP